ncbi:CPBP family intramembrane glutamic endopeptidase [Bacillus pseudomycoides]|nr:CPBP family intramembrane glutamic endopeptidase [Bacillus pseudomycoides]
MKRIIVFSISFFFLIFISAAIQYGLSSYYINSSFKLIFEGFVNIIGAMIGIGVAIFICKVSPSKINIPLAPFVKIKLLKMKEIYMILILVILIYPVVGFVGNIGHYFFENTINQGINQTAQEFPFFMVVFWGAICGPIAEELIFRGFLLNSLYFFRLHSFAYITVTVMSFSIFHLNSYQALYTIPISIVLTLVTFYTRNIMAGIWAHISYNFLSFFLPKYFPNLNVGLWYLAIPGIILCIFVLYRMRKSYIEYTYTPFQPKDVRLSTLFLIISTSLFVISIKETSLFLFAALPIIFLFFYQKFISKLQYKKEQNIQV